MTALRLAMALLAAAALLRTAPAYAAPGCEGRIDALEKAKEDLYDCMVDGGACVDEFRARDEAGRAAAPCGAAPCGAPGKPVAGVLVEHAEGVEAAAIETAAREELLGTTTVESGKVRAARAFLDAAALDDDAAERLRHDLGAHALFVIEVKADGGERFVSVRALSAKGAVRRFGHATAATAPREAARLVSGLREAAGVADAHAPYVVVQSPRIREHPSWAERLAARKVRSPRSYVDLNLFLGRKRLNHGDWGRLDSHMEIAALATFGGARWPVHAALDFYASRGEDASAGLRNAMTTELGIGVRRVFGRGRWRPYAGAGLALVQARVAAEGGDGVTHAETGSGSGAWIAGGCILRLGRAANVGLHARWSAARTQLSSRRVDAGGMHVGLTVGFGAGAAMSPKRPD